MPAAGLKPCHVVEPVDGYESRGDAYKRGGIVAVQRALNGAGEMGCIAASPVKKVQTAPGTQLTSGWRRGIMI
jgi:hypothetical protein